VLFSAMLPNGNAERWMSMTAAMNGTVNGTALFLEVYVRAKGEPQAMQQMFAGLNKSDFSSYPSMGMTLEPAFRSKFVETLSDIYSQGGDAALIKTLRRIRLHGLDLVALQPDQIGVWLREATNGQ